MEMFSTVFLKFDSFSHKRGQKGIYLGEAMHQKTLCCVFLVCDDIYYAKLKENNTNNLVDCINEMNKDKSQTWTDQFTIFYPDLLKTTTTERIEGQIQQAKIDVENYRDSLKAERAKEAKLQDSEKIAFYIHELKDSKVAVKWHTEEKEFFSNLGD